MGDTNDMEIHQTAGGILVARDNSFVGRYRDIVGSPKKDARRAEHTQRGWRGMRGMILKDVPDDTGIPVIETCTVQSLPKPAENVPIVTEGSVDTFALGPEAQPRTVVEIRRKIAPFEPLLFIYRRHRPLKIRRLQDSHPDDYSISIGMIADHSFQFDAFGDVHGGNRSSLIFDGRRDSGISEDGLEIDCNAARGRGYFGRLHDVFRVASTSIKKKDKFKNGLSIVKLLEGKYRAAINWTPSAADGLSLGEAAEPDKIFHAGGWVHSGSQLSNIETVFLFGGDDADNVNWDDEPLTILDIRYDAHFAREDSGADVGSVIGHQDGHIGFASIPYAEELTGSASSDGPYVEYIGWMTPDPRYKNKGDALGDYWSAVKKRTVPLGPATDLAHETCVWRPQIKIPQPAYENSSGKYNDSGDPPNPDPYRTQTPKPVVYTSPRRDVYAAGVFSGTSWISPTIKPVESGVDLVRFFLIFSMTGAIAVGDEMSLELQYAILAEGGTISPGYTVVPYVLDDATPGVGADEKFTIYFDIGPISEGDSLDIRFYRNGDQVGDTSPEDLHMIEHSWKLQAAP